MTINKKIIKIKKKIKQKIIKNPILFIIIKPTTPMSHSHGNIETLWTLWKVILKIIENHFTSNY